MTSGPTSNTVRENISHFRVDLGMTYADLARELERRGHGIPPLGLRRIEAGERRVDVDDLVALALALNVNPHALLLPRERGDSVQCAVTGFDGRRNPGDRRGDVQLNSSLVWEWAAGFRSLTYPHDGSWLRGRFGERVRPVRVLTDDERYEQRRRWASARLAELEEAATAEIAEYVAEGNRAENIVPSQHWEMKALAELDFEDDAYWATAPMDPAPPTRRDHA